MPIELDAPVTVPAEEAKTYNEVWMSFMQVMATDPNQPVRVIASMDKARTLADGSKELMVGGRKNVNLPDFFGMATTEELQIMGAVILAIKARAGL